MYRESHCLETLIKLYFSVRREQGEWEGGVRKVLGSTEGISPKGTGLQIHNLHIW